MKQLNAQQIKHIEDVLKKIEPLISDHNKPENRVDYEMLLSELVCSNKNWSERFLFSSLHSMKYLNKGFNYEQFDKLCKTSIEHYRLEQTIKYYLPVNYDIEKKFQLSSIPIKRVTSVKKHKSIVKAINGYRINSKHYEFNFDLLDENSYYFLEFTLTGVDYDECYDRFYTTFLLLRGILEFGYFSNMFSFKFGRHNPKDTSLIVHPPFVYIESKAYKSDLHFFKNRQTKVVTREYTVKEGAESVTGLIRLLRDECQENTTIYLLSNCIRLYSLAVDSSTWEHSFLYLWNILDEITLSQKSRGNTQIVLERCIRFTDDDFINLYRNKVYSLVNVRNNLVHKGINKIADTDVGLLKLIAVNTMFFLFEEIDNIAHLEQLELVYELKNVNIESLIRRQKIIDTIITRRTNENKAAKKKAIN